MVWTGNVLSVLLLASLAVVKEYVDHAWFNMECYSTAVVYLFVLWVILRIQLRILAIGVLQLVSNASFLQTDVNLVLQSSFFLELAVIHNVQLVFTLSAVLQSAKIVTTPVLHVIVLQAIVPAVMESWLSSMVNVLALVHKDIITLTINAFHVLVLAPNVSIPPIVFPARIHILSLIHFSVNPPVHILTFPLTTTAKCAYTPVKHAQPTQIVHPACLATSTAVLVYPPAQPQHILIKYLSNACHALQIVLPAYSRWYVRNVSLECWLMVHVNRIVL